MESLVKVVFRHNFSNFLKRFLLDIDECSLNANICLDSDEFCVNTLGSYKCQRIECPRNYVRDKHYKKYYFISSLLIFDYLFLTFFNLLICRVFFNQKGFAVAVFGNRTFALVR